MADTEIPEEKANVAAENIGSENKDVSISEGIGEANVDEVKNIPLTIEEFTEPNQEIMTMVAVPHNPSKLLEKCL